MNPYDSERDNGFGPYVKMLYDLTVECDEETTEKKEEEKDTPDFKWPYDVRGTLTFDAILCLRPDSIEDMRYVEGEMIRHLSELEVSTVTIRKVEDGGA